MCFVFISEQTATSAPYTINWLVFMTEMKNVYSAVRTGSLKKKAACDPLLVLHNIWIFVTSGIRMFQNRRGIFWRRNCVDVKAVWRLALTVNAGSVTDGSIYSYLSLTCKSIYMLALWLLTSPVRLSVILWPLISKRLYYLHIYKTCSTLVCTEWSGELLIESRNEIKARWQSKIQASRILSVNI